jgi:acetyl-CoA carboxylase biotin carboxyl carrier protein
MKRKKPANPSPTFANPEIEQIEQLLRFMTEHGLEEFEYSRGDLRIRLRKPSANVVLTTPRLMSAPEIIVPGETLNEQSTTTTGIQNAPPEGRSRDDLYLVKSPIVGTYYDAPSPGAEPFVKVGAHVDSGKTLCIVEAMKLMNEIESDISGEVLRIFVENGQPVEYGQPLFGIRPSRKK